jgi:hypothetical protein
VTVFRYSLKNGIYIVFGGIDQQQIDQQQDEKGTRIFYSGRTALESTRPEYENGNQSSTWDVNFHRGASIVLDNFRS